MVLVYKNYKNGEINKEEKVSLALIQRQLSEEAGARTRFLALSDLL